VILSVPGLDLVVRNESGWCCALTLNAAPFVWNFRSEEMMLAQLIIPADAAHETITLLGQVRTSSFAKTYASFRSKLRLPKNKIIYHLF
jgi:hypothetical protein